MPNKIPILNSYPLIDKTLSKIIKTLPYHWTSETLCILKFRIKKKSHSNFIFQVSFSQKMCSQISIFPQTPPLPLLSFSFVHFSQNPPFIALGHSFVYQNPKKSISIYGDIELSILITLYFRSLVYISYSLCIGRIDSMQYRANLVILEMLNIS